MNKLILAGCVITDADGKILLMHRNTPKRTQWELPGGKIDEGESPEETAVREIKEELGVDVELGKLLGKKEFTEDDFINEYIWYSAKITHGTPVPVEDKFDEVNYFSIAELEQMKKTLSSNMKNFLEALLTKEITL